MRISAAGFVFVALSATSTWAADTDHVTRTFQVGNGAELVLNNFSGHVRITGTDSTQIVVDATRHGTRSQLEAIRLDIRQSGSRVVVEANQREYTFFTWWRRNQVVETDFDVKVPVRTRLEVHAFSSPVEVIGVSGDHRIKSFSSDVRLEDVAGRVDVHTFSGNVDVRTRRWVDAESIEVNTFSGRVDLQVPESARGTAEFRSFSGRFSTGLPLMLKSSDGHPGVTAELNGSGPNGSIRVKTFSGSCHIGTP